MLHRLQILIERRGRLHSSAAIMAAATLLIASSPASSQRQQPAGKGKGTEESAQLKTASASNQSKNSAPAKTKMPATQSTSVKKTEIQAKTQKTDKPEKDSKEKDKQEKERLEKSESTHPVHAHKLVKTGKGKALFVPPPPPSIPTYLDTSSFTNADIGQVELLSLDDLKFQMKNLEKKVEGAKQDQKDQEENLADLRQKSERFDSLYNEGVVSKKELEDCKRDALRAERDLEQSKITLSEYERVLTRVKERIASLESAKKPRLSKAEKKTVKKKR